VLHVDRCHDSIVRREGVHDAPVALRVSWEHGSHADALGLARDLRNRGVACGCDLVAGGDGDVTVSPSGARWSHDGRDERGTIDAALKAFAAEIE
jgi:hypothetical protein